MTDEEIKRVVNEYVWAHSHLRVNKETYESEDMGASIPVDKLVMIPMHKRIEVAVTFGIRYALKCRDNEIRRERLKKIHFREMGSRLVAGISDAEDCLCNWLQSQGYDKEQIKNLIIELKSNFKGI